MHRCVIDKVQLRVKQPEYSSLPRQQCLCS